MDRALLIDPDNLQMRYNFACALAHLAGRPRGGARHAGAGPGAGPRRRLVRCSPTDPDFAGLRDDPRFQAMIAAAEARVAHADPKV